VCARAPSAAAGVRAGPRALFRLFQIFFKILSKWLPKAAIVKKQVEKIFFHLFF